MGKSAKKLVSLSYPQKKQKTGISRQDNRLRLADFIDKNVKQIVSEWESFARTLHPAANNMTPLALRNHIHEILAFIVSDVKSPQTNLQQIHKSQGKKKKSSGSTAAQTHAALRLAGGFDIDQMVSEWRALRASVIKLWSATNTPMNAIDILDLTRFNESIDQELAESVSHYTQKVSYSKDLFLGILGHDLRNPLNVISMSAQLMLNIGAQNEQPTLNDRQIMLAKQIYESSSRIDEIVVNLLDMARARFGSGLPVIRAPMDFGFVAQQLVNEMRAAYPARPIILEISGELKGEWDKARIGQVFSNLIGNAMQYSFQDSSIGVSVKGMAKEVVVSVHNEGVPIPPEKIATLFDAITRAVTDEARHPGAINLGLGLYITKDIVVSHGGTINVTSSEENGTTFTARFPRSG
jgi:signal transduction histidine kinase